MNRDWFDEQIGRLMVLRGAPASTDSHFEILAAVDTVALDTAVTQALKTRSWFPTPSELLHDVQATKPVTTWRNTYEPVDTAEARYVTLKSPFGTLTLKVTKDWRYHCTRCTDSGWASWWCGTDSKQRGEWMEPSTCGRREDHGPHEWVSKCACWDTNVDLIRKRDIQSQAAASRTAKSGRDAA